MASSEDSPHPDPLPEYRARGKYGHTGDAMCKLFPDATYRLQFHKGFTFRDATAIVPYLAKLGISHVYASPYLKAAPGSMHGYDVIDPCALNPEIGSEEDRIAWVAALKSHGMGHILDIVPNHVGIATNDNVWWNDVLENGQASRYAEFFDISWEGSPRADLHGRVLLPVLGKPYAEALEAGELKLVHERGKFWVRYYQRAFPISPRTFPIVHESQELSQINLAELNGVAEKPESFDLLDKLLSQQCYRLAYWRAASDEINYRRFFDINDLAALRMERPEVFDATHRLIMQWLADGSVQGLRIDHPDGLYDPKQYLRRLQEAYRTATGNEDSLYVVVEKILAANERLPLEWPVSGTSGYDFLAMTNAFFVDAKSESRMTRTYSRQIGRTIDYQDLVYQKKRAVLETALSSGLHMLARRLAGLAEKDRGARDFTIAGLRDALREMIACFPVYRSYVSAEGVGREDRRVIEQAYKCAVSRNPEIEPGVFAFVRRMLLLEPSRFFSAAEHAAQIEFTARFQQLSAPSTAKGIEDTSFYIYNRLVSLNEVGGDPGRFGIGPDELHAYFEDRQKHWPHALSPLSTHDTKRSEDVRARLNALSELPGKWRKHVARWSQLNACHRVSANGEPAPDANDEYLIYQTILGAWPLGTLSKREHREFVGRIKDYLRKAVREAKVHTSWTRNNEAYERAVESFIGKILDVGKSPEFFADFLPFQRNIARRGMYQSLAQTVLRLTAPGVPDTYQGTELWDFSLVDPDNRRPVDYASRSRLLDEIIRQYESATDRVAFCRELLRSWEDGRIKLFVIWRCLALRQASRGLFSWGDYLPLKTTDDCLFAFERRAEGQIALVVVPRLHLRKESALVIGKPTIGRRFINVFTGEKIVLPRKIKAKDLLGDFPVAVLLAS